jgi:hypothetical protein
MADREVARVLPAPTHQRVVRSVMVDATGGEPGGDRPPSLYTTLLRRRYLGIYVCK